ncbi:MAG: ABC transporter ATP-binding protein [Culicoidibacterales bacterium]
MISLFAKFGWYLKAHWFAYMSAAICLTIANICAILPPQIIGRGLDYISEGTLTDERLLGLVGMLIVIIVVGYIVAFLWSYLFSLNGHRLERDLKKRYFSHIVRMDGPFFQRFNVGDLMLRATVDLRAVSVATSDGVFMFLESTVYLGMIVLFMVITVDWRLTIAAIFPLLFISISSTILGKKIHKVYTQAQAQMSQLNTVLLESVKGVRVIRAYVQEETDITRLTNQAKVVQEHNVKVAKIDAFFEPVINGLFGLSYAISIGYGALLVFSQQITVGDLVAFNLYIGMLGWPLYAIGGMINLLQRGNASYDRFNEVVQTEAIVKSPDNSLAVGEFESFTFKDYTFAYDSTTAPVLKNIDVVIKKGQTIGLVGKTGGGRTTVIRQLLREYPLGTGQLTLNNKSIEAFDLASVRGLISYVPQEHILFTKNIRENVRLGNPQATDQQVDEAICLADFTKDIQHLQNGLETLVGEDGVMLSGGQKQRLSIARAFLANREILVLDDSLSAVDGKTEATIIEHLLAYRQAKTTVIIAHRLSAVQHADEILVFEDGEIIERGNHQQLLQQQGWYYEQFNNQNFNDKEGM